MRRTMTRISVNAPAILAALLAAMSLSAFARPVKSPVLTSGRFEQVGLTVKDLEKALTFYRDRLGLRLMFEANSMLFFDVGGTRLMIARDEGRQRPGNPTGILYFHVDD